MVGVDRSQAGTPGAMPAQQPWERLEPHGTGRLLSTW